tara:strand:+ start:1100 stop:2026 length:927 start_codon:yes stop_codon:yes gene_type:complete
MVKKLLIYKNFKIQKKHKGSIILIGNFDGLHLGHQKLFKLAQKYKNKYSLNVGVLTFEPMPKMYFNKNIKNFRISNKSQKIDHLKKFNVDFVIIKKFTQSFSKIQSVDFINKILGGQLKAKFIFVSNNFKFGNKREGDVRQLKEYEKKCNFRIIKPKPLLIKKKIVSSTFIRNLLRQGKLYKANKLLDRSWRIEGKVQRGRQLGKKIGFPTANIDINNYVLACPGVYAVRANMKNQIKSIKGIANLGYRPTFNGKKILLEVHLFNFSGNLYNKQLSVKFIRFIRKEKKFKNAEQLKKQIEKDLLLAKT